MPSYSTRSKAKLETCHPLLQEVFKEVIKHFDHTIICGHRNQEAQDEAFRAGFSKKRYPEGRHNSQPSLAVDALPYPIDWQDRERHVLFAGYVLGVAETLGVSLRWGGDWDSDYETSDTTFWDAAHFELVI